VSPPSIPLPGWSCPVCRGTRARPRFKRRAATTAPTGDTFRPSTELFGHTSGEVWQCLDCGHAAVVMGPEESTIMTAYADALDPISVREEAGQVETARRGLEHIEALVGVGHMVDLGCWTGSFLVAARDRGWSVVGVEASRWAAERARGRGVDIVAEDLFSTDLAPGSFRAVVLCDVLEHLVTPRSALATIHDLLEPGGAVYITVPNAGSAAATVLGSRWWSVLPMHLQYFTRISLRRALEAEGFTVRRMTTHAKAFSLRYYAERLGGYSRRLEQAAVGAVTRLGLAGRMVAPDFGDRLAVIATRD
jgi:SAM-dependent methyltransferase